MILDNDLLFSNAQAITASARSTNVVDTGPLFTGNLGRNLGVGEPLWIFIDVVVAMTDAGSDSTITVTLETDDNAAFSSAATIATLITIAAVRPAGTMFVFRVPPAQAVPYERFLSLNYTVANGNLTTGSLTAGIVKDVQAWASTASGFTTGY